MQLFLLVLLATQSLGATTASAEDLAAFKEMVTLVAERTEPEGPNLRPHASVARAQMATWNSVEQLTAGCKKPGDCGLAYQGCCYGAKVSKDPCTCNLIDGTGEVDTACSGTDKPGACGVAYTACCVGFKVCSACHGTIRVRGPTHDSAPPPRSPVHPAGEGLPVHL
jgi:hypothetical protein